MPPARKKRRSFQQIMEDASGEALRRALPQPWVLHAYDPDYGIDGTVEIFQYIDDEQRYAETLGETFLFQLKSTAVCDVATIKVSGRGNVEKAPYIPSDDAIDLEVVRYEFDDLDELVTIESMGAGVVVVLFLVCLDTDRVFFLNLTDYVEKVLTPESPGWRDQTSKTIYVPVLNQVTPTTPVLQLLRFYGLRPKLMGLFTKIHFQWAELGYGLGELSSEQFEAMVAHFVDTLLRYDTWAYPGWELLGHYHGELVRLRDEGLPGGLADFQRQAIVEFWFRMDAIGRTFEDVAREWGLPTALGRDASYPYGS